MAKKKSPPPPAIPERPASLRALGSLIRKLREHRKLTLDALMAKTGISKPYLSNIETGKGPGPASEEKLRRVARALEAPEDQLVAAADWLRTPPSVRKMIENAKGGGALPRRSDGAIDLDAAIAARAAAAPDEARASSEGSTAIPVEIPLRNIPLINRVTAGKPGEYTDLEYPRGVADDYIPAPDLPDAPVSSAFALKIIGDSMAPDYADGEIIIVGPVPKNSDGPKDGDDCVVRLGEEDNFATTFKRVYFVKTPAGQAVRLVPLNPKYPKHVVPLEKVTGIYPLMYRLLPAKRPQS
jgi:SOS-response transcriptional repressor LexA